MRLSQRIISSSNYITSHVAEIFAAFLINWSNIIRFSTENVSKDFPDRIEHRTNARIVCAHMSHGSLPLVGQTFCYFVRIR